MYNKLSWAFCLFLAIISFKSSQGQDLVLLSPTNATGDPSFPTILQSGVVVGVSEEGKFHFSVSSWATPHPLSREVPQPPQHNRIFSVDSSTSLADFECAVSVGSSNALSSQSPVPGSLRLGPTNDLEGYINGTWLSLTTGARKWLEANATCLLDHLKGYPAKNGIDGVNGTNGVDGVTGPMGLRGPTGWTGVRGLTGHTGVTGATGPTGSRGVMGPRGKQGSRGATGWGKKGATGVTGANGRTGATGATGRTGNSGARGATGLRGSTGATGATGSLGATGATGATGRRGNTGATGPTGPTGISLTGARGAQGLDGNTGATGNTGSTGASGRTGSRGLAGNLGVSGSTGATGASGSRGYPGPKSLAALTTTASAALTTYQDTITLTGTSISTTSFVEYRYFFTLSTMDTLAITVDMTQNAAAFTIVATQTNCNRAQVDFIVGYVGPNWLGSVILSCDSGAVTSHDFIDQNSPITLTAQPATAGTTVQLTSSYQNKKVHL